MVFVRHFRLPSAVAALPESLAEYHLAKKNDVSIDLTATRSPIEKEILNPRSTKSLLRNILRRRV
jgi:hypothetical protein